MSLLKEERRQEKPFIEGLERYKPSIVRIESMAREMLSQHDKSFYERDPDEWQTDYSLLNHCQAVSKTAGDAADYIGLRAEDVLVARVAGALHDVGKLHPRCHLYRLNRILDDKEMSEVDLHAGFSGNYINFLMRSIRKVDQPFWGKIRNTAPFHHQPWLLPQENLRKIAWVIKAADCFVAKQEHRHSTGITQAEAVKILPEIFNYRMPDDVAYEYSNEIAEVLDGFKRLYSATV